MLRTHEAFQLMHALPLRTLAQGRHSRASIGLSLYCVCAYAQGRNRIASRVRVGVRGFVVTGDMRGCCVYGGVVEGGGTGAASGLWL